MPLRPVSEEDFTHSTRIGGRYLVRRDDVEARVGDGAPPGRPYSPRRAWALILLADGVAPAGLDPVTLSKLRAVLRGLWAIRSRLRSRAERRDMRAQSSDLGRLESEQGAVLTGARHATDAGLGLVEPEAPVELYVDAATADRLVACYSLHPSDRPNVRLRVLPPGVRPWLDGSVAARLAVALDLAEDRGPRARAVARRRWSSGDRGRSPRAMAKSVFATPSSGSSIARTGRRRAARAGLPERREVGGE